MPNTDAAMPNVALHHPTMLDTAISNAIPEIPVNRVQLRRAEHLARRLNLCLFDAGIDRVVPTGWALPTNQGLQFGLLTLSQADQLVRRLEDLVNSRRRTPLGPGSGRLTLFKAGS
jgi:hypothetical protein